MVDLSEKSLEEALIVMRDGLREPIELMKVKPTRIVIYPPYLKKALRILGLIKQPIKRSAGMRKKKRNLYWRESV